MLIEWWYLNPIVVSLSSLKWSKGSKWAGLASIPETDQPSFLVCRWPGTSHSNSSSSWIWKVGNNNVLATQAHTTMH